MFTGIVETLGRVSAVKRGERGRRLGVMVPEDPGWRLGLGESVAVSGVCLTVVDAVPGRLAFDLAEETLRVTTLGGLGVGDPVNLERPLRLDGRLGGHFVQGHVDGTATVTSIEQDPPGWRLSVDLGYDLSCYCIEKGSIAINGVSLTIAGIRRNKIWVALVPYTWKHTALSKLKAGDPVNVEIDMLAKYVRQLLHPAQESSESEEFLRRFLHEEESADEG